MLPVLTQSQPKSDPIALSSALRMRRPPPWRARSGRRLQARCQNEGDPARLGAAPYDVPRHELLVGGVGDGDVDVRLPPVGRGDGAFEAEPAGAVGDDAGTAARSVAVLPCLPEDDADASERLAVWRSQDAPQQDVAGTDLGA